MSNAGWPRSLTTGRAALDAEKRPALGQPLTSLPGGEVPTRERDDEAGATVFGCFDGDGSAVALDDVEGDGDTETCAARCGFACLVDAGEAFEDPEAVVLGDSGSVVGDRELGEAVVFSRCQHDPICGVTGCVVAKVADCARELVGVTDDLGC